MSGTGPRRFLSAGLVLIVALGTGCSSPAQPSGPEVPSEPNTLTGAERAAGWRLLFDGTTTSGYAPSRDVTKPAGSWNAVRLIANRSHIEHWLNGVRIVEYELGSPDWLARLRLSPYRDTPTYGRESIGHIALQEHGARVAFRNLKLIVMP